MSDTKYQGCYTAIVTPIQSNNIDYPGFRKLLQFQIEEGISGIVPCGTTGESPTLKWPDNINVIVKTLNFVNGRCQVIAGMGSNCTEEMMMASDELIKIIKKKQIKFPDGYLIVEPYYNKPGNIRKNHLQPMANAVRGYGIDIIVYTIPGRTAIKIHPKDLAFLIEDCPNVRAIKEATGDVTNMENIRKECGDNFIILSGNDGDTFNMVSNSLIMASGVISVISNVVTGTVGKMVRYLLKGEIIKAKKFEENLFPLFKIVSVATEEETSKGIIPCLMPNPVPIKTLMNLLGMPAGECRPPLGKMTKKGLDIVVNAARQVWEKTPEFFLPIQNFFTVDIAERLYEDKFQENLWEEYR